MIGMWLVVFGSSVFISTTFRDVFVLPKLLPLGVGALLLHLAAARRAWNGFPVVQARKMDAGIAAVILAMAFSTVLSIDIPASLLGPHQSEFHAVLPVILYILVFYGISYSEVGQEDVSLALLASSVPISMWAILQHSGRDRWLGWSMQNGRAGSLFGSPIFLGAFLALVIPIAWRWAFKSGWKSALGFLCLGTSSLALAAARSRGGCLASIIGLVAYAVIEFEIPLLALIPTAIMCAGLSYVFLRFHPYSDLARFEIWKIALMIWKRYPILGSGPDTFGVAFRLFTTERFVTLSRNSITVQVSAHNDLLQVLATMGLLGSAAYALFLYKASRVVQTACKLSGESRAIAAALISLFVAAKVDPISFPVLAIAAAFLGTLDRPGHISEANWAGELHIPSAQRFVTTCGAVMALAVVIISATMLRAEQYQRMSEKAMDRKSYYEAAQDLNVAAQINPLDIHYTQSQLNGLWAIMPGFPPAGRLQAGVAGVILADRACLLHPMDATAHEIRAVALRVRNFHGDLDEADREIVEAEMLAPLTLPYFQWRAALAVARHDQATAIKAEARVAQLEKLQEAPL